MIVVLCAMGFAAGVVARFAREKVNGERTFYVLPRKISASDAGQDYR